jgi:hypothetical protein
LDLFNNSIINRVIFVVADDLDLKATGEAKALMAVMTGGLGAIYLVQG